MFEQRGSNEVEENMRKDEGGRHKEEKISPDKKLVYG